MAGRLLLHVCCAPCATSPVRALAGEGAETVLFFFNPNLHPEEEHDRRLAEARRWAGAEGIPLLVPGNDAAGWAAAVRGLEEEPEGGARCDVCFAFRLDRAARAAAEGGFEAFASTLSVSPHKDPARIDRAGRAAAARWGTGYRATDFKKRGGFQESVRLSHEAGLYRQSWCGCRYSRRPGDAKRGAS